MKNKIKKLLTRPNWYLWGVGLGGIFPLGIIFGLSGLIIQLAFLSVGVYNLILVIKFRDKYSMFDSPFDDFD